MKSFRTTILPVAFLLLCLLRLPVDAHEAEQSPFGSPQTNSAPIRLTPIMVSPEGQQAIGLTVQPVRTASFSQSLQATGRVQVAGNRQSQIVPPVTGVVSQINVNQGDTVAAGQTLAMVQSPQVASLLTQVLQDRANLEAQIARSRIQSQRDIALATSELNLAQQDYQREQQLHQEGISARKELLQARSTWEQAQVRLKTLQTQAAQETRLLQQQLAITTRTAQSQLKVLGLPASTFAQALASRQVKATVPIKAPFAGVVAARNVSLGQNLEPGQAIFTIVNTQPVWVILDIFQNDLPHVYPGQPVSLQTPSGATVAGEVDNIGTVIDPQSRTLPVRVVSQNLAGKLKPGMYVTASLTTSQSKTGNVVIPSSALVETPQQALVYVAAKNRFQPVLVTTGRRTDRQVEITSGLYPGDKVVVTGARQLYSQSLLQTREADAEHHDEASPAGSMALFWLGLLMGLVFAAGAYLFARWQQRKQPPSGDSE